MAKRKQKKQDESISAPVAITPQSHQEMVSQHCYSILAGHTQNKSRAKAIAGELAKALSMAYEARLRAELGLSPDCIVNWQAVCSMHITDASTDADVPAGEREEIGVPSIGNGPASLAPSASIKREDVMRVLHQLLLQASAGNLSASDTVKVTESIAKLEGMLNARDTEVHVYTVNYLSPEYEQAQKQAEVSDA
jgi:hypothetical protein